jgi:hypothetical protein
MDKHRPFWIWFSDLNVKRCSVKAKIQKGFLLSGSNAVRRWLEARYPVTRASQSRDGGRIPRAGWLKQVWDSAVRGYGSEDHKHRANCI